jgi:hypothetical protein
MLCALLVTLVILTPEPLVASDHSDWMSGLSDDLLITELTIPGTHETMALYEGLFGQAQCQNLLLIDQLERGIRFLDIRCYHYSDYFRIFHGDETQFALFDPDVRDVCVNFLTNHPSEVIFMRVAETNSPRLCTRTFAQTLEASLAPVQEFIYQSDDYTRIPSLDELRGKIVIFESYPTLPEDPVLGPLHDGPFTSVQDDYASYECLAGNTGKTPGGKWYEHVLPHLESAINGDGGTLYLNYLNCAAKAPDLFTKPHGFAWGCTIILVHQHGQNERMIWWLQSKLDASILRPWFHKPLKLGVIMMDFFDEQEREGDYLVDLLIPHNPGIGFPARYDWMSTVPDTMLVSELSVPGTQGSMTCIGKDTWERSQNLLLAEQLKAGIRALEVECLPEMEKFRIVWPNFEHREFFDDQYKLPAEFGEDVLKPCVRFLNDHPSETILLRVQKVCFFDDPGTPCDPMNPNSIEWWEILERYLTEDSCYVEPDGYVRYGDFIWQSQDYSQMPSLSEVRGKIIILQDFESPEQFGLLWSNFHVQDSREIGALKWDAVRECFLSSGRYYGADDTMFVNYVSNLWPYDYTNPGLNESCYVYLYPPNNAMEKLRTGIVMMDYPGPGLIGRIIEWYNPYTPTSIDEPDGELLPATFSLLQNYPNPFNPSTTISFSLPVRSIVRIDIYNVLGRRIRNLIDKTLRAGSYSFEWDGCDDAGNAAASGVYFYRLKTSDFVQSRKMMLLR